MYVARVVSIALEGNNACMYVCVCVCVYIYIYIYIYIYMCMLPFSLYVIPQLPMSFNKIRQIKQWPRI